MKQVGKFIIQRTWKVLMTDMGLRPGEVLTLAGLPTDMFSRKEASLSPADYFQLWRGMEQAAGDGELPLMMGQAISVEAFDPPIFASLCSPHLNAALHRLSHFKALIGPLMLAIDVGAEHTTVVLDCYGHQGAIPRCLAAAELVLLTQFARLATRQHIVPQEVELAVLPANLAPYEAFFGCALTQGNGNRLSFHAADAVRPFLTEDAAMWAFFETELNKRLSDLEMGASMTQRVRSVLLELLPSGQSTIDAVAKRLAVSKRTLQRTLSEESCSYQDVLGTTRKELAQHYLTRSSISLGEVSWLLGFQDSNSFQRAFKVWTGTTPGEYRLGLRH